MKTSKSQRYLLMGFLLSLLGGASTQYWYVLNSKTSDDNGNRPPIAQLVETKNEVQKRPSQRLIWQSLNNNAPLYQNDTVRTLEKSDARLQFLNSKSEITLEPESLILIVDEGNFKELELLQGNMFIKGAKGDNLRLKVGENTISVEDAQLSTGKSTDGGGSEIQVFSGQAKLLTKAGEIKVDKTNSGQISANGIQSRKDPFKIVSPKAQGEIHVQPNGQDRVEFEWEKLTEQLAVSIEMGSSRKNLAKINPDRLADTKFGSKLPPGDYFWRLVGTDPTGAQKPITSTIYRFKVLPKRPPVPVSPEPNESFAVLQAPTTVRLEWSNPGQLKGKVLEIAESADLKAANQTIRDLPNDFYELQVPKFKKYFWRVSGVIPSTGQIISSDIQSFTVKAKDELTRAELESPLKDQKLYSYLLKEGTVTLQWKPASGAKNYQVMVRRLTERDPSQAETSVADEATAFNTYRLKLPGPGTYIWRVKAFNEDGKKSTDSEVRQFTYSEAMAISWANTIQDTQTYWSNDAQLELSWQGIKNITKYKVVAVNEDDINQMVELDLPAVAGKQTLKLPTAGRYIASVSGINAQGQVIAKTEDRKFNVTQAPFLPAPTFKDGLMTPLSSQRDGSLDVEWTTVDGAKQYVFEIRTLAKKVVSTQKTTVSKLRMDRLMPGQYEVRIAGIDQANRPGAFIERPLSVPDRSDILPPKLKGVKVE